MGLLLKPQFRVDLPACHVSLVYDISVYRGIQPRPMGMLEIEAANTNNKTLVNPQILAMVVEKIR